MLIYLKHCRTHYDSEKELVLAKIIDYSIRSSTDGYIGSQPVQPEYSDISLKALVNGMVYKLETHQYIDHTCLKEINIDLIMNYIIDKEIRFDAYDIEDRSFLEVIYTFRVINIL